jgi:hypothetical protein
MGMIMDVSWDAGEHVGDVRLHFKTGRVGGVVVSVLATGSKGCGFEPGQCYGFYGR